MSGSPPPFQAVERAPIEARVQLLVAEFTWVAGLIRYYREVELKALAGTGLVLSGVGAAFGALRVSNHPQADDAIGIVFAIAALITAFVLPVVVMANLRGARAVSYVREWLHPLAAELAADDRFLAWERVASGVHRHVSGRVASALKPMLSGAVVVFLIGTASLALVIAAWTVEHSSWSRILGAAAAVCDAVFMGVALALARLSERGGALSDSARAELGAQCGTPEP
jgi:hypothetical protein